MVIGGYKIRVWVIPQKRNHLYERVGQIEVVVFGKINQIGLGLFGQNVDLH